MLAFPSICGRLKDGRECGQKDSTQGPRISTLSLPTLEEHKSLHWRPLLTERAAVIHLFPPPIDSHGITLSLWELLALLFSVHETGREEAVVLFFLLPRLPYIREATWKRPQPGHNNECHIWKARCQEIICCTPYHDLRMSTGWRSSSSFMLFQLLQHVQVPCWNNSIPGIQNGRNSFLGLKWQALESYAGHKKLRACVCICCFLSWASVSWFMKEYIRQDIVCSR